MDAANPAIIKAAQESDQDKPVDLVFILRGGATDVYTLICNLRALQERLPHIHLSETNPYILADSAGAYPAAGLVGPSPINPLDLPAKFKKNIGSYLSRDRKEAEQALQEDVGNILIRDTSIPVTISTMEITKTLEPAYFTNFPSAYTTDRPGFTAPANQNDDVPVTQAVLASSAFAFILGDHRIGDRRFMDMAFLETHPSNLLNYYLAHKNTERRIVCAVFGNNYSDFQLGIEEELRLASLKRHFASAVRARAQTDLVNFATTLFGKDNVIDLSLYIPQPFRAREAGPASNAFRRDELAIRERISWTERQLKNNPAHAEKLDRLAEIIRVSRGAQHEPTPGKVFAVQDKPEDTPSELSKREKILSHVRDVAPALTLAGEVIAETVSPLIEQTKPLVEAGVKLTHAHARVAGSWLGAQWTTTVQPWLLQQIASLDRKLLPNYVVRLPAQPHSSEPHTRSEFERKPL